MTSSPLPPFMAKPNLTHCVEPDRSRTRCECPQITDNSPKRREALRRFGDRARSMCECSQPIPESPQGHAAVRRWMEMGDRARSEVCPGVCGCTLCSRTHSSNRHLHPRPLTTKFQKPAGPASFCCKAAAHDDREVGYCQSAAGKYATTSAHTRFEVMG